MVVSERDQERFEHPQQSERRCEYQGNPDHEMQPYWGFVLDLYDECCRDDNEADDKDDEYRRAVPRVVVPKIQSTAATGQSDLKIAIKQSPLSAARTAASQSGAEGRDGCWHY